jgi:hypothetical protein
MGATHFAKPASVTPAHCPCTGVNTIPAGTPLSLCSSGAGCLWYLVGFLSTVTVVALAFGTMGWFSAPHTPVRALYYYGAGTYLFVGPFTLAYRQSELSFVRFHAQLMHMPIVVSIIARHKAILRRA